MAAVLPNYLDFRLRLKLHMIAWKQYDYSALSKRCNFALTIGGKALHNRALAKLLCSSSSHFMYISRNSCCVCQTNPHLGQSNRILLLPALNNCCDMLELNETYALYITEQTFYWSYIIKLRVSIILKQRIKQQIAAIPV